MLTNFQRKLIKIAIQEAKKCDYRNKSRHVSFLCQRNTILSCAVNNEKRTHTLSKDYIGNKIHSECAVIYRIRWLGIHYAKCRIITIRIDRDDHIRNSRPCKRCVHFLALLGITKIFFTNDGGEFEKFQKVA